MRKLVVGCLVSVDGVHGEPRSWVSEYFDDEAAAKSLAALARADAMLMGRNTYEYFAPAWPQASGPYAERVNSIRKYVFSSTLASVEWRNSTLVAGDPVAAVRELKAGGDGDLVIYGYGRLARTLLAHGLVEELRVDVNPVMVGAGTPLFQPGERRPLALASIERRGPGVVTLVYVPA
ncbi:dihydrofolate reductase family protein [Crossiella sp. SN42]|uniref:dihydrofolate reductase family protein n=1 Tax=Crossiella sp. SN42 TaxID=2944808 RepID=UPI00207D5758|nr:dihydrofolate reductase family protein [Crossiella sp. SN42]MCO1578058.1 dihydrofolate reductase family protein [Crossiella sp. SN42]